MVRLWNVNSYHEERAIPGIILRGHVDVVVAARYSKDGASIVTASPDRMAKRWRVSDGAEEVTFREGHAYLTARAIFFPDKQRLLSSAMDGTVRVWSVATGAELLKLTGTGYRAAAALSPSGRWILTGSDEEQPVTLDNGRTAPRQAAILWDADSGQRLFTLVGHKAPVTAVAFSADNRWAFSGDDNGVGNLWEAASGRHVARLDFHVGSITSAAFTPDGKRLLTASSDTTVCPWDISDPRKPQPLYEQRLPHPRPVNSLALTSDGSRLLTGCEDGKARLWALGLESPQLVWPKEHAVAPPPVGQASVEPSPEKKMNINAVAISPNGNLGLTVDSENHVVRLLEMESGREVLVPSESGTGDHFLRLRRHDALGWSATFSTDGDHVLTVGGDEARLWNLQGTEVASFGPHRPLTFADFSPDLDNPRVITAGWDNSARIWDARTGRPIVTLADQTAGELGGHKAAVNSAVFSPDGQLVLTASEDGTIRLWNVQTMRVLTVFTENGAGVTRAVFSKSGRQFISASRDGTAAVWSLADNTRPLVKINLGSAVLDIAFSPDEKFVAGGCADTIARVWEAGTGLLRLELKGHSGEVTAVAFSPAAQGALRLLTGSADRTAKLWDVHEALAPTGETTRRPKELLTLKGHTRSLTSVGFSPSGSEVLTAGRDGVAILWPSAIGAPSGLGVSAAYRQGAQ